MLAPFIKIFSINFSVVLYVIILGDLGGHVVRFKSKPWFIFLLYLGLNKAMYKSN